MTFERKIHLPVLSLPILSGHLGKEAIPFGDIILCAYFDMKV